MKHKYFFPASDKPPQLHHLDWKEITHCIDIFQTLNPATEWLVVLDSQGRPHLLATEHLDQLPATIRREIAINEMLSNGPSRVLKCKPLYLFALESFKLDTNTPGVNDPVYLNGESIGPFFSDNGRQPVRQKGQLLSCRADILESFLQSMFYSFHYSSSHSDNDPPSKMHNLLLAIGDNDVLDDLAFMMVYPTGSLWHSLFTPGNEQEVKSLIFKLLKAIQSDMLDEQILYAKFKHCTIPIPDLATYKLEQKLDGATVTETYIKPPPPTNASWLQRIFHNVYSEKTPLPQEGDLLSFACLTQKAVKDLPEWPSNKERWLKKQVIHWQVYWSPDLAYGITPVKNKDGLYEYLNGTMTNLRKRKNSYSFLYFDINDDFAADIAGETEISIEYFDNGLYRLLLEYCAENNAYKMATPFRCPRHGNWHWATFTIDDAVFNNTQNNGADFRLCLGGADTIKIRQIKIRKFASQTLQNCTADN